MNLGQQFDQVFLTQSDMIINEIQAIVTSATKNPLSIFTDYFHHRFMKKKYLESMMEILQQFYVQLMIYSPKYQVFVGDQHKYCLTCLRCQCAVTPIDFIEVTMTAAPMAMLCHWRLVCDKTNYLNTPMLFPDQATFDSSIPLAQ